MDPVDRLQAGSGIPHSSLDRIKHSSTVHEHSSATCSCEFVHRVTASPQAGDGHVAEDVTVPGPSFDGRNGRSGPFFYLASGGSAQSAGSDVLLEGVKDSVEETSPPIPNVRRVGIGVQVRNTSCKATKSQLQHQCPLNRRAGFLKRAFDC